MRLFAATGFARRRGLVREHLRVEMTATAEELFRKLGERFVAKGKPVTTHAVLMALRFNEASGGRKVLEQANLLQLEPPAEEDEGDAGMFSPSLERALASAQLQAYGSPAVGTQHLLFGMLREETGLAGRWLRDNGLRAEDFALSEYSDPEPEPKQPPSLMKPRFVFTFFLAAILWAGVAEESGPLFGLFVLLFLPDAVMLWIQPQVRKLIPDRCWRCKRAPELPAMRDSKSGLCPSCQQWLYKVPARNYLRLILVLATAGAVASQYAPTMALILGNVLLAILLDIPVTIIHEVGHWVAGRLSGHRLLSIHIGRGGVRQCFRMGTVWCYFQWPPQGGLTIALQSKGKARRLRTAVNALGGPVANFVVVGMLWPLIQSSDVWVHNLGWGSAIDPLFTFFILNLSVGFLNLWPTDVDMGEDLAHQTDGMIIWRCLKASPEYSPKLIQQIGLMNCSIYRGYGNYEAELRMFEHMAPEPTRDQKFELMLLLLRLERMERVLQIAEELLEPDPESSPEQRGFELNSLAWAYYLAGALAKADELSAESIQLCPGVPSIMGTRGEVLAALGRFDEGRELLERSVALAYAPYSASVNCKALSRLAALRGDQTEFDRLNALISRLNPDLDAYLSLSAAVEDAKVRGHALTV